MFCFSALGKDGHCHLPDRIPDRIPDFSSQTSGPGCVSCDSRRDPREQRNKGCRWAGSHQEWWGEPGPRLREFLLPQPVGVVRHAKASQTVVISRKQPQITLPEIRPIKRITGVSKYSAKSPTLKISHEEAAYQILNSAQRL